jgi:hypothetical protein
MSFFRFVSSSLAASSLLFALGACGSVVIDEPDPSLEPTGGEPEPEPQEPGEPLPEPSDTLVADHSTPARYGVERADATRAERCRTLQVGGDISPGPEQGVWEASLAGSRKLASGQLTGAHYFNEVVGVLGDEVYVQTWGGMLDDLYGLVAVDLVSGAETEVVPMQSEHYLHRVATPHEGALYVVDERSGHRLLRLTSAGIESLASLPVGDWSLRSDGSGLYLSASFPTPQIWRWDGLGLAPVVQGASGPINDYDLAPDGELVYAVGEELFLTGREAPLVRAVGNIESVRVDRVRGEVIFSVSREAPAKSSVYWLVQGTLVHALESTKWQSQDQEQPLRVLAAALGTWVLSASCSNDEDAPDTMPIRYNVDFNVLHHVIDQAAYPYVDETVLLQRFGRQYYGEPVWRDTPSGPIFYVRR